MSKKAAVPLSGRTVVVLDAARQPVVLNEVLQARGEVEQRKQGHGRRFQGRREQHPMRRSPRRYQADRNPEGEQVKERLPSTAPGSALVGDQSSEADVQAV